MPPNATLHNPDPGYCCALIDRLRVAGMTQTAVAKAIGIQAQMLRRYKSPARPQMSYPVQFALECLARHAEESQK